MKPVPAFGERLRHRERVWCGAGSALPYVRLHRYLDRVRLRSRRTPLAEWRCCEHWQRCLLNKWNSREFAVLHGAAVPELYWYGRDAARMPIDTFPDHFVIRPSWGAGTRGTCLVAGNVDRMTGDSFPDRRALKAKVIASRGRFGMFPLLVEEYLTTPEGDHGSGVEYKFFMFGGHVGTVMTFERRDGAWWVRHYTPDWQPIAEKFQAASPLDTPRPRPPDLDEMTTLAKAFGASVGTFIRVDFYATSKGVVFGEFSSLPSISGGFTPFADDYLGRLWQEYVPDRV